MRRPAPIRAALLCGAALAAASSWADELEDPYFGEALYYAYQDDWFAALERMDTEVGQQVAVDEPNLDSLYTHFADAEFSLGDVLPDPHDSLCDIADGQEPRNVLELNNFAGVGEADEKIEARREEGRGVVIVASRRGRGRGGSGSSDGAGRF